MVHYDDIQAYSRPPFLDPPADEHPRSRYVTVNPPGGGGVGVTDVDSWGGKCLPSEKRSLSAKERSLALALALK